MFKGLSVILFLLSLTFGPSATKAAEPRSIDGVPDARWVMPLLYARNLVSKFVLGAYDNNGTDKVRAFKDTEAALLSFIQQKRWLHRIETREDFEKVKALYFPRFNSLSDELAYRRARPPPPFFLLVPANAEIEKEIEDFWKSQSGMLGLLSELNGKFGNPLFRLRKSLLFALDHAVFAGLFTGAISDNARRKLIDRLLRTVDDGIKRIDATGAAISRSGAINFDDKALTRFFTLAIGEYFKELDSKAKADMLSALMNEPDTANEHQKFSAMILNAGPQFQKLFQLYAGRQGFSPELRELFTRLQSNGQPAPWRLVKPLIDSVAAPFEWLAVSTKPIAVGTMAQTHPATIRLRDGQIVKVAVRVLKPDIAQKLTAENSVLNRVALTIDNDAELRAAGFPRISPVIQDLAEMIVFELDIPGTIANQKRAAEVYTKTINAGKPGEIRFRVPRVYETGPSPDVMVMEWIDAMSFSAFEKRYPDLAKTGIEEFAKLWIEEALFKTGFYQADAQAGNLMVAKQGDGVQFTITDFGMCGQLERRMQAKILALAALLRTQRADLITKALWEISVKSENTIGLEKLSDVVATEIARLRDGIAGNQEFGEWLRVANNAGIKFPMEFTSLNRGLSPIIEMLRDHDSRITAETIIKDLMLKNPRTLLEITRAFESINARDWAEVSLAGLKTQRPFANLWPFRKRALNCSSLFK